LIKVEKKKILIDKVISFKDNIVTKLEKQFTKNE